MPPLWQTREERMKALAAIEESFLKPIHETGQGDLQTNPLVRVAVAQLRHHLETNGERAAIYLHRVVELLSERHDIIYPSHERDTHDEPNP